MDGPGEKLAVFLVGPMGSGKTTYCLREFPNAHRVSGDEMGRDRWLENYCKYIEEGRTPIVVDRMNHLRRKRDIHVKVAREHGYRIQFIWFKCDYETAMKRLVARDGNHPTIKKDADLKTILGRTVAEFDPPERGEYDELTEIEVR